MHKLAKLKLRDITDDYMLENGYWTITTDKQSAFIYDIIIPSEKWRMLFDTCMRKINPSKEIITPELILKVINDDDMRRHRIRNYKKIPKEEKLRRKLERQRLKAIKSNERRTTK